jgi:(p)ppGpp synthase/HD superfamily hydrolase
MTSENKLYALAISIVAKAFEDRLDKGGLPYFLHCMEVSRKQITIKRKIIGILHDLIEDTNWDFEDLSKEGFPLSIIIPLKLLTHDPTTKTYEDYIRDISTDEDARAVKLADLIHNSNITRLKGLTKSDFAKMERYHKAYTYLSKT